MRLILSCTEGACNRGYKLSESKSESKREREFDLELSELSSSASLPLCLPLPLPSPLGRPWTSPFIDTRRWSSCTMGV
jgi:hypothetical protein